MIQIVAPQHICVGKGVGEILFRVCNVEMAECVFPDVLYTGTTTQSMGWSLDEEEA